MYQGETITILLDNLPIQPIYIQSLNIIFHTATKTILVKTLDDCLVIGNAIQCKLSQEDTLRFPCGPVEQSIIVIYNDGSRFEFSEGTIIVNQTSKQEVIL